MTKQKQKMEELRAVIEEEVQALRSEPPTKETQKTEEEIKPSSFLRKSPIAQKSKDKSAFIVPEIHKKELDKSMREKKSTVGGGHPINLNKSQLNNNKDSVIQTTQKSVGKTLNNSSLIGSPSKRFQSEKDRLRQELQNRLEEIVKLSDVNSRLKEKLKEYQGQNEANVQIFQQESAFQNLKYRQLFEANKLLQEEQLKTNEKIHELLLKNYSLAKNSKENEDFDVKLDVLRKTLERHQRNEESIDYFQFKSQKVCQKRVFQAWKSYFLRQKALIPQIESVTRSNQRKALEYFLNQWQKFYFIRKIISAKKDEKATSIQLKFFHSWRSSVDLIKRQKRNLLRKQKRLLIIAMVYWKQLLQLKKKKALIQRKAEIFRSKAAKKRFFPRWIAKYRLYNFPMSKAKELNLKAEKFQRFWLKKRAFKLVLRFYRGYALPTKRNQVKAGKFHTNSLKNRSLAHWKSLLLLRKSQEKSVQAFLRVKTKEFLSKFLTNWCLFARMSRLKTQKTQKIKLWFMKSRYYKTWRRNYQEAKSVRESELMVSRNYTRKLELKTMKALKRHKYLSKRLKKTSVFYRKKREESVMKMVFSGMRMILSLKKKKFYKIGEIAKGKIRKGRINRVFLAFKDNYVSALKAKISNFQEKNNQLNHELKDLSEVFRENQLLLEENKKNQRKINEFHELTTDQSRSLTSMKSALEKAQSQVKELLQENQEKTRKIKDLSLTNEELSVTVESLNKSLEKRLRDSKAENEQILVIIQSLKDEIAAKDTIIKAQQREFHEKDEGNRAVIENLQDRIESLLNQLSDHNSQTMELQELRRQNESLVGCNRNFAKQLDEMKDLEYKLRVKSMEDQENFEEIRKKLSLKKEPLNENREKNLNVLDCLNREIEDLKVNRNNLKENIEMRLKMLSQNIDSDFSRGKIPKDK